jgi:hypothetical protein
MLDSQFAQVLHNRAVNGIRVRTRKSGAQFSEEFNLDANAFLLWNQEIIPPLLEFVCELNFPSHRVSMH